MNFRAFNGEHGCLMVGQQEILIHDYSYMLKGLINDEGLKG